MLHARLHLHEFETSRTLHMADGLILIASKSIEQHVLYFNVAFVDVKVFLLSYFCLTREAYVFQVGTMSALRVASLLWSDSKYLNYNSLPSESDEYLRFYDAFSRGDRTVQGLTLVAD
jgi:hypothetical protein